MYSGLGEWECFARFDPRGDAARHVQPSEFRPLSLIFRWISAGLVKNWMPIMSSGLALTGGRRTESLHTPYR